LRARTVRDRGGRGCPCGGPPRGAAGDPLPARVLTLPPPLTFLRPMTLPVTDLPRRGDPPGRARGNLSDRGRGDPVRPPAGPAGRIGALLRGRRAAIVRGKRVGAFRDRRNRGWTASSPIRSPSFFSPPEAAGTPRDGIYLSTLNDVLAASGLRGRRDGGRGSSPGRWPDRPEDSWRASGGCAGAGGAPLACVPDRRNVFDAVGRPPGAERVPLPEGLSSAHLAAYGGGAGPAPPERRWRLFRLRTSAEAPWNGSDRRWKSDNRDRRGARRSSSPWGAFLFAGWTEGENAARARALVKKGVRGRSPRKSATVVQAGGPDPPRRSTPRSSASQHKGSRVVADAPPRPPPRKSSSHPALPKGECIEMRGDSIRGEPPASLGRGRRERTLAWSKAIGAAPCGRVRFGLFATV